MSPLNTAFGASGPSSNDGSVSPQQTVTPKTVAFELTIADSPEYRARLPMRVKIYPHDTTDSIVTTVKNFYGLYSGPTGSKGVSFEDYEGNTLIARYENFQDRMVVYVRVIEEAPPANPSAYAPRPYHDPSSMSGHPYYSDNAYPAPQASRFTQEMSRPNSRSSRRRSPSPNTARGRRSASASTNGKKGRSRSSKTRASVSRSHTELYSDSINGYSSNDEHGSTSGKNKDQIPNPDISMDNIVEGGRRKRAKFESSVSGDRHFGKAGSERLTTSGYRNCPCSHPLRCRQQLRTLPCLPLAVLNLIALRCPLCSLIKTLSRTPLAPCNRRKAIAVASHIQAFTQHQDLTLVATEIVADTLAAQWEFFLRPTLLWAAASLKKIRTLPFS